LSRKEEVVFRKERKKNRGEKPSFQPLKKEGRAGLLVRERILGGEKGALLEAKGKKPLCGWLRPDKGHSKLLPKKRREVMGKKGPPMGSERGYVILRKTTR